MKKLNQIEPFSAEVEITEYHPYDPNLPLVFLELQRIIQNVLPEVKIEHVGSSSIPGVGGRNAIDIVIPAEDPEQGTIRRQLLKLGFQVSPFKHFMPLLVGGIEFEGKVYTILLYVISSRSQVITGWITFRDYMRTHPGDARSYALLKQQTVAAGKRDGWSYQRAKTPFLESIMKKLGAGIPG